ncbi:MAG: sulfatase-like hydrolase/transferase [Pseudomonadota bacterium]
MGGGFQTFLACLIAISGVSFIGACDRVSSAESEPKAPPNIILVLFEDLSPRFGSFGDPVAHTPAFDRIASEGIRYSRVFTSSGVCAPSRAALISGRYQHTIGAQHMRTRGPQGLPIELPGGGPAEYLTVPPVDMKAFPELLRASGYHTSNDAKTDYQFGEPSSIWDVSGPGADWSGRANGQPFFHMQTILTTHESAIWPVDMEPTNIIEQVIVSRNRNIFASRVARTDPAAVEVPPYLPDTPAVRRDIATHYDNIAFSDAALGKLYERLASERLLENTILIVSTDHGDGLPRMKRSLYDSGLLVPMIIRFPDGRGAGEEIDELISFIDLAPTILSWADTPSPSALHGFDFDGEDRDPPRQFIFAAQDRMDVDTDRRRAVRNGRFKYIRNYIDGDAYFSPIPFRNSQPTMKALWAGLEEGTLSDPARALFDPLPEDQLYDTVNDPHEINNLAGSAEYSSVQAELEAALDNWLETFGDLSVESEADMIENFWPNGVQPKTAPVDFNIVESGVISLSSVTPGASIEYAAGEGDRWTLYTAPLQLPPGTELHARAVRYGFEESPITDFSASSEIDGTQR